MAERLSRPVRNGPATRTGAGTASHPILRKDIRFYGVRDDLVPGGRRMYAIPEKILRRGLTESVRYHTEGQAWCRRVDEPESRWVFLYRTDQRVRVETRDIEA